MTQIYMTDQIYMSEQMEEMSVGLRMIQDELTKIRAENVNLKKEMILLANHKENEMQRDPLVTLGGIQQELSLLKSIFETHYTSLVMNLRLKETKKGHMEWFDIQKISVSELKEFTQDHEILQYIEDKQIPYRDR
jgi:hypothetical protein